LPFIHNWLLSLEPNPLQLLVQLLLLLLLLLSLLLPLFLLLLHTVCSQWMKPGHVCGLAVRQAAEVTAERRSLGSLWAVLSGAPSLAAAAAVQQQQCSSSSAAAAVQQQCSNSSTSSSTSSSSSGSGMCRYH
jgi:hypothetical protein